MVSARAAVALGLAICAAVAVDAGVTNYTFTTSWPKTGGPKAANCTLGPPQACAWFAARVPSVPLKILQPGMFHC